jgi:hypothetical protein
MSAVVIRNFLNSYKYVLVGVCNHKNIKMIPFPKYPINTDCDIKQYSKDLENYIRIGNLKNPEKFNFKHVISKFPKEYFNYESI